MISEKDKQEYQTLNKTELSNAFSRVCYTGDLEVISYILTYPKLRDNLGIVEKNNGFLMSCMVEN